MSSTMTESAAKEWIYNNAFSRARIGRVGAELEWLVIHGGLPGVRVELAELQAILKIAVESMPAKGCVSVEPGGQLELSTVPADTLAECLDATARDLALLRWAAARSGLCLIGKGLDDRPAVRVIDTPRYVALERSYDRYGPDGRTVMCNAASVQVNVDAGDTSSGWSGWRRRWWLANSLGPVFTAMFANSPVDAGATGKSGRQLLRFRTDPTRTKPLPLTGDPREGWAEYALNARVVSIMEPGTHTLQDPPVDLTMRDWLRGAGPRPVIPDDLHRHLRSVIPPVRPRGYLELRMIDAQEGDNWVVPVVTVSALLDDLHASDTAVRIVDSLLRPVVRADWMIAARDAMNDPRLAGAARHCMVAVIEAMDRLDVPAWARSIVLDFADAYTFRSRCPADDGVAAAQAGRIETYGRDRTAPLSANSSRTGNGRVLAGAQPDAQARQVSP